ncbi:MAG: ornithine cyclodeaminase family protein [Dehalococcoidia bacterium]|nr:ornithine cyclodeaminase family protein [Dehalococcoidia bacterium]
MLKILTDDDVDARVSMCEAVHAVERALADKVRGVFVTPPRHYVSTGKGLLVFTIGGHTKEGVVGFRVYGAGALANEEQQLVAVYDAATGELRGIVTGARVGVMRTGALGGVAIKYAAREHAKTLAVIGSGVQARAQIEAAAVVRDLSHVRVYSRSAENREAFASEMSTRLGVPVTPVATPEQAIAGADIVVVATSSRAPVFDASLIEPGMHVTTIRLGRGQHELDPAVAERAGAIFTDSTEQLRSYPGGFFLEDRIETITDLSEYVASGRPVRSSADEITLYCSTGLSGTEVVVADVALRK